MCAKNALLNLWVLWEKKLDDMCKQPNRGNLTYYSPLHSERGWGWGLCVLCMPEAFCGIETVRKWVLLNLWALWEKEMSFLRDKTPQRVVCVLYHTLGAFYFSQKNTEEQTTQSFTETLSQPISQNVTANLSWKASVNSVCRRRSVGSKLCTKNSVNSVRSVREKTLQRVVCVSSHQERWL